MKRNRAYVLLTVLLLLTLAAVVLAGVCRLAVSRSLQASSATDELQRKWGTISCRDTLLPRAENILELAETPSNPVKRVHGDFTLGTEQFSVDISDEQAKANANAIYSLQGKTRAEQTVRQLIASTGSPLKPRFRLIAGTKLVSKSAPATNTKVPAPGGGQSDQPDDSGRVRPLFGSWSEIFDAVEPNDLAPMNTSAVTFNLTCWGGGKLNVMRASPASIAAICGPTLSPDQINRVLALRTVLGDNASVDRLLAGAHVGTADAFNVAGRLTVASATHSLWVVTRDHSAVSRSLFVRDSSNSGDVRSFTFQW